MNDYKIIDSSFRDPNGFVFHYNNELYRQINLTYKNEYDYLMGSGLYEKLVEEELLIPHEEVTINVPIPEKSYKIIKPEIISFISYPYEWCFSQLQQAAITTLEIQKISFEYGISLKDATAYNIQFKKGKPILIDTLSFEKYVEGQTWKPYRQFCQHFLAPLALMSHKDIRLNQLFRIYIDGIPLDLATKLLPMKTFSMFSLLSHIHLHAKTQKHYESKDEIKIKKMPKNSFIGIIDSLYSGIKKMKWKPEGTEWGNYYYDTNYSDSGFEEKKQIVSDILEKIKPKKVWDLGANTGIFSRISSKKGIETISFDIDPAAVEKNYLDGLNENDEKILPLLLDLTNPSPNIGWSNQERDSLITRGPVDVVVALALVHHLAISNNIPLFKLANFFQKICKHLIIEFVPKTDSQIKRLLVSREDIFDEYTQENFEKEFQKYFKIYSINKVMQSERTIYHMEKI